MQPTKSELQTLITKTTDVINANIEALKLLVSLAYDEHKIPAETIAEWTEPTPEIILEWHAEVQDRLENRPETRAD